MRDAQTLVLTAIITCTIGVFGALVWLVLKPVIIPPAAPANEAIIAPAASNK